MKEKAPHMSITPSLTRHRVEKHCQMELLIGHCTPKPHPCGGTVIISNIGNYMHAGLDEIQEAAATVCDTDCGTTVMDKVVTKPLCPDACIVHGGRSQ